MSMGRRRWAWLLSLALVLAQTLGLVHGQLHAGAWQPVAARASAASLAELAGTPPADGATARPQARAAESPGLFAGHRSDGDCRLFDQLAHGDAAFDLPRLALPLPAPFGLLQAVWGEAFICRNAPFDARGPPGTH